MKEGFPQDRDPRLEHVETGVCSLASEKHPESNEDAWLNDPERLIFGVFDGMGGHAAGKVASASARDYASARLAELGPDLDRTQAENSLREILEDADGEVLRKSHADPAYYEMGTTATVVKIFRSEGRLWAAVGNVGDSRLYRFAAGGKLEQVTLDDGPIREHFHNEEEARNMQKKLSRDPRTFTYPEQNLFSARNRITQCLGWGRTKPAVQSLEVSPGEVLLLTSDGIHDNLTDEEIELLSQAEGLSAEDVAVGLAESARKRSREKEEMSESASLRAKADDMTAVVLRIPS